MTRLILLIAALLLLAYPAAAQTITGQARVIDGDTIEVAGTRIRLFGIDAPESHQTCEGTSGVYECGRDASAALAAILRDRIVTCEPKDRDRYGRTVATCSVGEQDQNAYLVDIGAAMVRQGWAVVYRRYAKGAYEAEEAAAKAEKLGIWSGRFEPPDEFRRRHRR